MNSLLNPHALASVPLEREQDAALPEGDIHPAQPAALVENLRLKYPGDDSPLLFRGLHLTIERGQKVLLLGPSGCGKSTLLQVLGGLVPSAIAIPMKADRVLVPSRPGYVFQDPDSQFCMPHADEEIAFALENRGIPREEMPARISRCLSEAGLLLENIHTPVASLSQGMKQRLAIAAMLAMEPDVLLLDEPTALLDGEGTRQVWSSLRAIWPSRTVIIVEHKVEDIAADMDRVVVFGPDGGIIADGQPHDVFRECRQELRSYGIWYPGFWDDYDREAAGADADPYVSREQAQSAPAAARISPSAGLTGKEPAAAQPAAPPSAPPVLLELDGLEGLRGGQAKIKTGRLTVRAGDWIAITGVNGAGKSSLLLAIMKLIRTAGNLVIPGVPAKALRKPRDLARHAAFSFQNPEFQFVTDSVREELSYSLPLPLAAADSIVDSLMDRYGLNGLDERHPYQLSMGQKRRLSVATAMAGGQRLLLLDEPTFGLDASGTVSMMEQLGQLRAGGCGILMITHDPALVRRFATREWQVHQGQVMEVERGASSS